MEEPSVKVSHVKRAIVFILCFIGLCVIFAVFAVFSRFFGVYGLIAAAVLAAVAVYFTLPKKKDS